MRPNPDEPMIEPSLTDTPWVTLQTSRSSQRGDLDLFLLSPPGDAPSPPNNHQADREEKQSTRNETDIPWSWIRHVVPDMVDLEEMVIHHPFDEVEDAPPREDPAKEVTTVAAYVVPTDDPPQKGQPESRERPGTRVEDTVGHRVPFQSLKGRDRMTVRVAQKVMPLQQLVEHDAVEEAAETKSQKDARSR